MARSPRPRSPARRVRDRREPRRQRRRGEDALSSPASRFACPTVARSPSGAPSRQGIAWRRGRFRQVSSSCSTGSQSAPRGDRRGRPHHARVDEQRGAGRARSACEFRVGAAAVRARGASGAPSWGTAGRTGASGTRNFLLIVPTSMCASHEAQQIAMMAEFSRLQARAVPERGRRRCHPAQPRLRLRGRLEHPGDAADALQLRRSPERRWRDLHRPRLREDQPDGGRALPPAARSSTSTSPSCDSASRRRVARRRSSSGACRRSRRCCRSSTRPRARRPLSAS